MSSARTSSSLPALVSDADHVELSRLLVELNWRLDNHQAGALHELVTDDIVFQIGDEPVVGRDALKAWGEWFDETDPLPGIRHSLSNPRFVSNGPDRATGTVLVTAFFVPADGVEKITATVPYAVGEDHDSYVRTSEGWRLASRRWSQLFTR